MAAQILELNSLLIMLCVTCVAVEEAQGTVEKQRRRAGTQLRLACCAGENPRDSALNP